MFIANTPSPSVGPFRRIRYPLDNAGRYSVRCGELFRRWDRITPQDSSWTSVRIYSDSVSGGTSGVEAEMAFPPPVGVVAIPDCSGDDTLGFGVATGVDEACGLNTLMGIMRGGGSRNKSEVALICSTINSNGICFVLLCCSAKFVHANCS